MAIILESMISPDIESLCHGLCTVHWTRNDTTQYIINVTPKSASDVFFGLLQARARAAGYTIWMRSDPRSATSVEVIFVAGVPPVAATRWIVAGSLLLATII